MERDKIKSLLPLREQQLFEDIVTSRVLGANCHIRLIGEMLTGIAKAPENSREEILDKTRQVADFFMQTRGRQSRAIYNAVRYYMSVRLPAISGCLRCPLIMGHGLRLTGKKRIGKGWISAALSCWRWRRSISAR